MSDARLPDIAWVDGANNPWGVPILDVRPVTQNMTSTSRDPRSAENAVSFAREAGASFRGVEPAVSRPIGAGLRYRIAGPLSDGALFCPTQMEHKWALFYEGHRIVVVRSWRRQVQLVADVVPRAGHIDVTTLHGALADAEEDPEWTVRAFDYLMRSHALDTPYPVPLPDGMEANPGAVAMWCMSLFGKKALYATPHRLHIKIPDNPLQTWTFTDPPLS